MVYDVDINFDQANEAWMHNKKKLANGCYKYRCGYQSKNSSKVCNNLPIKDKNYCRVHKKHDK